MTKKELIKELEKYPDDNQVMCHAIPINETFEIKRVEHRREQNTIYIVEEV